MIDGNRLSNLYEINRYVISWSMNYDATPIRTLHRFHTDGVINTYAMEITVNIDTNNQ